METENKQKEIKIPQIDRQNFLTLEGHISALILIILQHCTYNSIWKNSLLDTKRISRNTIKSNLEQGKISPESFDSYIKAFGEIKQFNFGIDGTWSDADIQSGKEIYAICYKALIEANELYKMLKNLPYTLFSKTISSEESVEIYSQRFWYLLNKCFEAFCTLKFNDVMFLIKYFKSDEAVRKIIMTKMNSAETASYFNSVEMLLNGEGSLWVDAHKNYSSNTEKKSSSEQNWEILNRKLQNFASVKEIDGKFAEKPNQAVVLSGFFALIWPEEGEADTKFGPKEIEALIIFKYFLTEESRQKLIDELYGDQSGG